MPGACPGWAEACPEDCDGGCGHRCGAGSPGPCPAVGFDWPDDPDDPGDGRPCDPDDGLPEEPEDGDALPDGCDDGCDDGCGSEVDGPWLLLVAQPVASPAIAANPTHLARFRLMSVFAPLVARPGTAPGVASTMYSIRPGGPWFNGTRRPPPPHRRRRGPPRRGKNAAGRPGDYTPCAARG